MTPPASVTLSEVLGAARARAASLVPETSAYLVLAMAEAILAGRGAARGAPSRTTLGDDGSISAPPRCEGDLGRAFRSLLRALLAASTGTMPSIAAVAEPSVADARPGPEALVADLEAALIPLNRAAAKRALARLARETVRARAARALPDVGAELDALFGAEPAPAAMPSLRRPAHAPRLDRTPVQPFAVQAVAAPVRRTPTPSAPLPVMAIEEPPSPLPAPSDDIPVDFTGLSEEALAVSELESIPVPFASDSAAATPAMGSMVHAVLEYATLVAPSDEPEPVCTSASPPVAVEVPREAAADAPTESTTDAPLRVAPPPEAIDAPVEVVTGVSDLAPIAGEAPAPAAAEPAATPAELAPAEPIVPTPAASIRPLPAPQPRTPTPRVHSVASLPSSIAFAWERAVASTRSSPTPKPVRALDAPRSGVIPLAPGEASDLALRARPRSARELATHFAMAGEDQALRAAARSLKAYAGLALTPPPPVVLPEAPTPSPAASLAEPAGMAPALAFAGGVARRRVSVGWLFLLAVLFAATLIALELPLVTRLLGR